MTGRGGHASAPQDACDPVPAAAAMVGGLQTLLTRRVGPQESAVLTVSRIEAGTTDNVIPETALLTGTLRTLSEPVRALLHQAVTEHCRHTALAYGCTAEVEIVPGYPVTRNDDRATARLVRVAEKVLGRGACVAMPDPLMGAEDFSYVLDRVPGSLAFLGARPPSVDPALARRTIRTGWCSTRRRSRPGSPCTPVSPWPRLAEHTTAPRPRKERGAVGAVAQAVSSTERRRRGRSPSSCAGRRRPARR